ncbi:hypothetical protein SBADM41S_07169 [Streptomyces badius]
MGEGRDGLDGLAEAHLIPDDHPFLRQREARPERLVAAQGHPQSRVVEPQRPHAVRDPGGQEPFGGIAVGAAARQLGEQAVVLADRSSKSTQAWRATPGSAADSANACAKSTGSSRSTASVTADRTASSASRTRARDRRPATYFAAGSARRGRLQPRAQQFGEPTGCFHRAPRVRACHDERFGVWGGLSEKERERLRREGRDRG